LGSGGSGTGQRSAAGVRGVGLKGPLPLHLHLTPSPAGRRSALLVASEEQVCELR
jgi:hypothetical protein